MGDPRKPKKQWSRPSHPWQSARIEEERALRKEFGLKNAREIWKMKGQLAKYQGAAKRLTKLKTAQSEIERGQLRAKLSSYGLMTENDQLSHVLTLTVRDFLDRRLETVVAKKGLANTPKQARQFITHGHIVVNGKKMTAPSYMVKVSEEASIEFSQSSALIDEAHPERAAKKAVKTQEEASA